MQKKYNVCLILRLCIYIPYPCTKKASFHWELWKWCRKCMMMEPKAELRVTMVFSWCFVSRKTMETDSYRPDLYSPTSGLDNLAFFLFCPPCLNVTHLWRRHVFSWTDQFVDLCLNASVFPERSCRSYLGRGRFDPKQYPSVRVRLLLSHRIIFHSVSVWVRNFQP